MLARVSGFSTSNLSFWTFFSGSDTTSTAVEWAMAELLRNGDVLAKVRMEMAESMGGRGRGAAVSEADVGGLPYLQAVVKETQRLHPPPVPFLIPHRAEAAVELGGYTPPKHAQLIINAADGHVWENPTAFVPERFLDSHIHHIDSRGRHFDFIPFGAGRRICPAMSLPNRVVPFILASLLHFFDLRLPVGGDAGVFAHGRQVRNHLASGRSSACYPLPPWGSMTDLKSHNKTIEW
ncbi:hypothetical protein ACLOJK_004952 [Asimina triloba]